MVQRLDCTKRTLEAGQHFADSNSSLPQVYNLLAVSIDRFFTVTDGSGLPSQTGQLSREPWVPGRLPGPANHYRDQLRRGPCQRI
jgi:hypothetical protein